MRILEITGKLQLLQKFAVFGAEDGKSNQSTKDSLRYMRMQSHVSRLGNEEKEKKRKRDKI